MERTLVQTVCMQVHPFLQLRLEFLCQTHMEYQVSARLDERCILAETLHISLVCTVYIQMVGVNGGNYSTQRGQMVERTVKLVGLDNHSAATVTYH